LRVAVALLVLALLGGCGAQPPDLFLVERSGPDPAANLEMEARPGCDCSKGIQSVGASVQCPDGVPLADLALQGAKLLGPYIGRI